MYALYAVHLPLLLFFLVIGYYGVLMYFQYRGFL